MTPASRLGRRDRDRIRKFLLTAVSLADPDVEVTSLLAGTDVEQVVELARWHRVAALVHDRLRGQDGPVPASLMAALRTDHLMTRARQLQAHATIAELRRALDVPFLIIKGAALAASCYREPSLRMYVDVDVLVRRTDFRRAIATLTEAGFGHLLASWDGLLARGMSEVPLRHQAATVDLHWHLIAQQRARQDLQLDESALFSRSWTLRVGTVDVDTLDPEDTLLHLCIHSGLDGGRRLQQLVDVDRAARRDVDWPVFVSRAHAARAHALCAAILQRSQHLIGTPLPGGLLKDLAPYAGYLAASRLIDKHPRPDVRIDSGIASGILVAAGRATLAATLRGATAAVVEAVRERSQPRSPKTARHGNPHQPVDSQGLGSHERYFEWVDAHALPAP